MDVACFYKETVIPTTPDRAFKAMAIDAHRLMPRLLPKIIASMSIVSGDGGASSIKQMVFTEESGLAEGGPQLDRVDHFDPENFAIQQTVIQGGLLFKKMDSVVYEVRYEALGADKCICKVATEYHPKEGSMFKEEDIKFGRHMTSLFYQTIINYLITNPDAYA